MTLSALQMTENPALAGRESRYTILWVDSAKVLKSWRQSLYSFEWLTPDGSIRDSADLPMQEHQKHKEIEKRISQGVALERPVLGIGIMDNVEIGAGKAVFLTLAAQGHKTIEVYIPVSNEKEFKAFLA